MSTLHLVDPEYRPIVETMPKLQLSGESLQETRIAVLGMLGVPLPAGASRREIVIPENGGRKIRLLAYEPAGPMELLRPAILHIHGGGFVLGSAHMLAGHNWSLAQRSGAVVVSVDCRLAPEAPFPGPLDDCHAALVWLLEHAGELNV